MISKTTFTLGLLTVASQTQLAWANEFELETQDKEAELANDHGARLLRGNDAQSNQDYGWFVSSTYQAQTREQKMADLWERIVPDEDDHTVAPADYQWAKMDKFFTSNLNGVFCRNADDLPRHRPKTTHTQGLVAKVEWRKFDNDQGIEYTGIYSTGSDHVILRLSETLELTTASQGLIPGVALKFLIDGKDSENLVAMSSLTGIDEEGNRSWDFFHRPLKNRVERFTDSCELETKEKKMIEASNRPYATGVSQPGQFFSDGTEIAKGETSIPWELRYSGMHNFEETDPLVWYDQLRNQFKAGETIMEVHALTAPEQYGGELVKIADIVLKTDLYTSVFGDENLFFEHQRVTKDLFGGHGFPKQWKVLDHKFQTFPDNHYDGFTGINDWPTSESEAESTYMDLISESGGGCPFSWLFQ